MLFFCLFLSALKNSKMDCAFDAANENNGLRWARARFKKKNKEKRAEKAIRKKNYAEIPI